MKPAQSIVDDLLRGGPLETVDVVDCHVHMGPALYMQVPDSDADGLVSVMDGIGVSVVCVSHSVGMVSDWYTGNCLLMEAVAKHPKRIFGYAFFNPRYPKEMDAEMDRCRKGGLRGLKIHPDFHQTPATSPLYDRLYERAQAENRALLCHYGGGPMPLCGAPLYREVVRRFPKTTYIMAHSLPSVGAVDMAVEFFGANERVHFCLANAFAPGVIEYAARKLGTERLLFGSDGCWGSIEQRLGMVCCVNLPEQQKHQILGQNMRRIIAQCS